MRDDSIAASRSTTRNAYRTDGDGTQAWSQALRAMLSAQRSRSVRHLHGSSGRRFAVMRSSTRAKARWVGQVCSGAYLAGPP